VDTVSASVVIATRNRKDDLCRAIKSALIQDAQPEVIVVDDGSTDGTSDMVCRDFPQAKLMRSEQSEGYIAQRNRAACVARGSIVFSIDDDAAFSTPRIVSKTLTEFDDGRIGAVAIPYINVRQDNVVRQLAPDDGEIYVADAFIGTAHALRRDLFLTLGSYRECLFHQGEERDYCVRLMGAGYYTRLGCADPVHHYESPRRDLRRMDVYGRRNDILFAWHNAPLAMLGPQLLGTTARGLAFGFRVGRPWRMIAGLARGYAACPKQWSARTPISHQTFRQFRALKKRGPLKLSQIAPDAPSTAREMTIHETHFDNTARSTADGVRNSRNAAMEAT